MNLTSPIRRRAFVNSLLFAHIAASIPLAWTNAKNDDAFSLNYLVSSCMYGYSDLAAILPEVSKLGSTAIDLWPKVHGNQREQLDELGEAQFTKLLRENAVSLGCITQYKLGPFALQDEMRLAKRFGCKTIVTGAVGPTKLKGDELKTAIAKFVEQMKPHLQIRSVGFWSFDLASILLLLLLPIISHRTNYCLRRSLRI